jgi:hypothetical protein
MIILRLDFIPLFRRCTQKCLPFSQNFNILKVSVHVISSPGEFHPHALSEPDLRLSPHPAPIIQPLYVFFCSLVPPLLPRLTAGQNGKHNPFAPCPLQALHHYYELFRPCSLHRYFHPCGSTTWSFLLTSMSRFPSSIEKPVLGSCQLYTGHRVPLQKIISNDTIE